MKSDLSFDKNLKGSLTQLTENIGSGLIQEEEKQKTPSVHKSNNSQKSGSATHLKSQKSMKSTNSRKSAKENSSDHSKFSNRMILKQPIESHLEYKPKSEFPSNYNVLSREITIIKAPAVMSIYEP